MAVLILYGSPQMYLSSGCQMIDLAAFLMFQDLTLRSVIVWFAIVNDFSENAAFAIDDGALWLAPVAHPIPSALSSFFIQPNVVVDSGDGESV
jgi:hypothetical protein